MHHKRIYKNLIYPVESLQKITKKKRRSVNNKMCTHDIDVSVRRSLMCAMHIYTLCTHIILEKYLQKNFTYSLSYRPINSNVRVKQQTKQQKTMRKKERWGPKMLMISFVIWIAFNMIYESCIVCIPVLFSLFFFFFGSFVSPRSMAHTLACIYATI